MKTHRLNTIEKEIILDRKSSSIPSMLKISSLYNDKGEDFGKLWPLMISPMWFRGKGLRLGKKWPEESPMK
jgi:hypothetical protein